jgi:Ras-related protein Rab-8A
VSQAYYRNAHGCIAVYDICNRDSFASLADQIQSFINYSPQDCARNIVLIGNKLDMHAHRQVEYAEAV